MSDANKAGIPAAGTADETGRRRFPVMRPPGWSRVAAADEKLASCGGGGRLSAVLSFDVA